MIRPSGGWCRRPLLPGEPPLQAAGLTAATGAGPVQDGSQKSMIAVINPSKIEVLALGEESHFYVEQDVLSPLTLRVSPQSPAALILIMRNLQAVPLKLTNTPVGKYPTYLGQLQLHYFGWRKSCTRIHIDSSPSMLIYYPFIIN